MQVVLLIIMSADSGVWAVTLITLFRVLQIGVMRTRDSNVLSYRV